MKKILILLATGIIILSGCVTQRRCQERYPCTGSTDTVKTSETVYIPHDSIIMIPGDSSYVEALIECKGNTARLMQIVQYGPGNRMSPPKIIIRDNIIRAECLIDSSLVSVRYYEKHVTEFQKTSKTVVVKENYLTGWQWFQVWLGRILFGVIIISLIVFLVRFFIKRYTGIKL